MDRRMAFISLGLAILAIGVSIFCLAQAAKANVTPIIAPVRPAIPVMTVGATAKPTPDNDGYLHTPPTPNNELFTPPVTAVPFGGRH